VLALGVAPDHHPHKHASARPGARGHGGEPFDRAFAIGVALNIAIVVAEVVVGYLADSLALIADSAHNSSDVVGLLLAWGSAWLARRRPTTRRTYGYRRASIMAALGNAALLLVATGGIIVEALSRLRHPEPVANGMVIGVATLGIVVNGATALLFMRGRHHDLNIRGAFLHMTGDAAISFAVVVAAALTILTGWLWLDPAISLAIAFAVLLSGWGLARASMDLALDAVPAQISRDDVHTYLRGLPGVSEVHDLHIWAMSTTEAALTAHLVRPGASLDDRLLREAAHELERRFGIMHATLQMEDGTAGLTCQLAPETAA
jgi:cobalt-zinc-cadmium efflux system protein